MFVKQDDFKILRARVNCLEKKITGKLDVPVETGKHDWCGYPIVESVPLKDVVEQILIHFGLSPKFTPAEESKFVLRGIKDGKKKPKQKKEEQQETVAK